MQKRSAQNAPSLEKPSVAKGLNSPTSVFGHKDKHPENMSVTLFLNASTLPLSSIFSTLRNVHYKSSLCASRILQSNLQVKKITKIRKDERQSSDYENKMTT